MEPGEGSRENHQRRPPPLTAWPWPRSPVPSESFVWLCPSRLDEVEVGLSKEALISLRLFGHGGGEASPTSHAQVPRGVHPFHCTDCLHLVSRQQRQ